MHKVTKEEQRAVLALGASIHAKNYKGILHAINVLLKAKDVPRQVRINNMEIKACALFHLDRFQECIDCFNMIIPLDPSSEAELYVYHAGSFAMLGRHSEALKVCEKGLKIFPQHKDLLNYLMCIKIEFELYEEVLKLAQSRLDQDPKNMIAYIMIVESLYRQTPYFTFAKKDPNPDLEAINRKVKECRPLFAQMLHFTQKALELEPKNFTLLKRRTLALFGFDRFQEALECCERALSEEPQDGQTWQYKGTALFSLGRHEEAKICFLQAQKLGILDRSTFMLNLYKHNPSRN